MVSYSANWICATCRKWLLCLEPISPVQSQRRSQSYCPLGSFMGNPSGILAKSWLKSGERRQPLDEAMRKYYSYAAFAEATSRRQQVAGCMLQASRSFHFASHNYVKLVSGCAARIRAVCVCVALWQLSQCCSGVFRLQSRPQNFPTWLGFAWEIVFKCGAKQTFFNWIRKWQWVSSTFVMHNLFVFPLLQPLPTLPLFAACSFFNSSRVQVSMLPNKLKLIFLRLPIFSGQNFHNLLAN